MINLTADNITDVFESFAKTPKSERARDILVNLARHLHQFVRETKLTHEEWRVGLDALTRAGDITDATRNEFSLFSDMFGISSLVDMINSPPGATPSSVLGPFHQRGAPIIPNGGDLWKGQAGQVLVLEGQVVDAVSGASVAGATLDLWQNADNGLYSAQDPAQPEKNYHGMLTCDDDGRFALTTTCFKPYTVPSDGPGGDMLRALGREAWRPAHLHLIAEASGYLSIVTELFSDDDPWLAHDAAFGVRESLVLKLEHSTDRDALPPILTARGQLPSAFKIARFYHSNEKAPTERQSPSGGGNYVVGTGLFNAVPGNLRSNRVMGSANARLE